jgi:hypothetical protein
VVPLQPDRQVKLQSPTPVMALGGLDTVAFAASAASSLKASRDLPPWSAACKGAMVGMHKKTVQDAGRVRVSSVLLPPLCSTQTQLQQYICFAVPAVNPDPSLLRRVSLSLPSPPPPKLPTPVCTAPAVQPPWPGRLRWRRTRPEHACSREER